MKKRIHLLAATALALTTAAPAAAEITVDSDPVLFWNDLAIKLVAGGPPAQARVLAILNTAMHDAVVSAYGGAGNYYSQGLSTPGGNARAAASVAAREVLVALNGTNTAAYDAALAASLAKVKPSAAKTNGMTTGAVYATAILTARANDGSNAVVPYTPGTNPGEWRPTSPAQAVFTQWGGVTPFVMTSGTQFSSLVMPPSLTSADYTAAYNEVKAIGSATSATRTADQTASALFWDASTGTTWHRIAVDVLADDDKSTLANARIMAEVSAAISDSFVTGFASKYEHNLWRPVTAIREGDNDTNDDTVGDAGWNPLFGTPPHPSFLSTHSLQSGAASAVLLALTSDQGFTGTVAGDTRTFTGIGQAAVDAANSRLWGGIHFRFDNEMGLSTGESIGRFALDHAAFNAVPEPATWAMMIAGFGVVGAAARRRRGTVAYA